MRALFSIAALASVAMPAFAVDPTLLPEPGSIALLGIGAVVGLVVYLNGKKQK